jgi:O-antigen/teichoic acid export membrane protein
MSINKLLYDGLVWRGIYFISAFILNIALARTLGAEHSGLFFYLISILTLVLMTVSLGTESAVGYFTANKQIGRSKLVTASMLFAIIISLVVSVGWLIYINYSTGQLTAAALYQMLLVTAFITGNYLIGTATMLCYSNNDFITPNIVSTTANVLLLILLSFSLRSDVITLIYLVSFFIVGLQIMFVFIVRVKDFHFTLPTKQDLAQLFKYSFAAYAGNLLFFLLYRVDYWFVERFCTFEQLGNYIQVSKLAQMFFVLPAILASAVFPYTASGNTEEVTRSLTKLCRGLLIVYGSACALIAATGYWLFPYVYGSSFDQMYSPFLWLIPGILALSTLFTLTAYFAGRNRQMVNIKGAVIALVIILVGDMIFIPLYGINGAAAVSSAGYIAYHIYVLKVYLRHHDTSVGEFFSIRFADLHWLKNLILHKRGTPSGTSNLPHDEVVR